MTDPHINPQTGVWDDNYYANIGKYGPGGEASGGSGGGGGNPVDALLSKITDYYTNLQDTYNKKFNDYTTNNPFVFDDVLKQQTADAQQRLDPYYQQTMGDFLTGINIKKSRSLEDERNLLTQLQGSSNRYIDQNTGNLEAKNLAAGNQYDTSGLGDSGISARTQGQNINNTNQDIQNYIQPNQFQQNQAILNTNRLVNQDLPLARNIEARNLNQEEQYNVGTQAQTAAQQAQNNYEFARQQYTGPQPGVTPDAFTGLSSILSSTGA